MSDEYERECELRANQYRQTELLERIALVLENAPKGASPIVTGLHDAESRYQALVTHISETRGETAEKITDIEEMRARLNEAYRQRNEANDSAQHYFVRAMHAERRLTELEKYNELSGAGVEDDALASEFGTEIERRTAERDSARTHVARLEAENAEYKALLNAISQACSCPEDADFVKWVKKCADIAGAEGDDFERRFRLDDKRAKEKAILEATRVTS